MTSFSRGAETRLVFNCPAVNRGRIKTMLRARYREGLVGGDQASSFCQGGGVVKAFIDRLIEVKGYRMRGGDITGGR